MDDQVHQLNSSLETATMQPYGVVFLAGVGAWPAAARFLATGPVLTWVLSRWGHILLPVALIGIGLIILVDGGGFGR